LILINSAYTPKHGGWLNMAEADYLILPKMKTYITDD